MTTPSAQQPDLLVVARSEHTVACLLDTMREHEVPTDLAHNLAEAREAFLERGGQRLLVFAPDLAPATARAIADGLTSVDPALGIVVFGAELLRQWRCTGLVRMASYHPDSRAGAGSLLKIIRNL